MSNTMTPDQCFDAMAKVLFPDQEPSGVGYEAILQRVKKLNEQNKDFTDAFQDMKRSGMDIDTIDEAASVYENVVHELLSTQEEVDDLQTKADAWDIHCEGEWEDVSRSWSAQQCRDLISCGACRQSDFQKHEAYQEVKGSRVDMEAFEKLKQEGQMPWSK